MEKKSLSPLVYKALTLMEERSAYLYGIEELAGIIGVSKHHLIREFSVQIGVSPGKYLTALRIAHAKALLLQGNEPIEIVATAVGFANGNYFAKVFKKATGLSPLSYRKKMAGTDDTKEKSALLYL